MSDKPKCPVFGCTIPRGIPHEHPAGVSAVMRDPVEPLNADERSELESLRRQIVGIKHHPINGFSCHDNGPGLTFSDQYPGGIYVVPTDAPMVPGRKLRDALLEAGQSRAISDASNIQLAMMTEIMNAPLRQLAIDIQGIDLGKEPAPEQRRTLAQSVGKIAAWVVSIPVLVLATLAIGTYCGWWV